MLFGVLIRIEIDKAIDVLQSEPAVGKRLVHRPSLYFLRIHSGQLAHPSFADPDDDGIATHFRHCGTPRSTSLAGIRCRAHAG